jgi:hypothetical protein
MTDPMTVLKHVVVTGMLVVTAVGCGSGNSSNPDANQDATATNPDATVDLPTPNGAFSVSRPAPGGVAVAISIDFGTAFIGDVTSKRLRLFNGGQTPRTLQISLSASTVFAIAATSTCGASLPAGQECSLDVTCTPLSAGALHATIAINTDLGPALRVDLAATAAPGLHVNFPSGVGSTDGRVEIVSDVPSGAYTTYATCFASRTVQVAEGTALKLVATTPFGSKLFTGDCVGDEECVLTRTSGSQTVDISFQVNAAVNEQWTRRIDKEVVSVAMTTTGNVIVAGSGFVNALSATGEPLWELSTMSADFLEPGPNGTIYGHSVDKLYKLSAAGTLEWSRTTASCEDAAAVGIYRSRCFGVNTAGDIAFAIAGGIQIIDTNGVLLRTLPAGAANDHVAIDDNGITYLLIPDPFPGNDGWVARRFDSSGTELSMLSPVCSGRTADVASTVTPVGVICGSASFSAAQILGHHVSATGSPYKVGVAAAATGDVAWMFGVDGSGDFQQGWTMERLSSTGVVKSKVRNPSFRSSIATLSRAIDVFNANKIAAGKAGGIAIAGVGFGTGIVQDGFVTVFHP